MKKIITFLTIFLLLGSFVACGKNAKQVKEPSIELEDGLDLSDLEAGTLEDLPEGLEVYAAVKDSSLYHNTEINDGKNFFYTAEASKAELYMFYKNKLSQAGWEFLLDKDETQKVSSLQVRKDGSRLNVFIYDEVPATYPAKLGLSGTFVSVFYDFETPPPPTP